MIVFSLACLALAMWVVNIILANFVLAFGSGAATYNMLPYSTGSVDADITSLITYIVLIAGGIYLLTSLPLAAFMLTVTRVMKSPAYDIDVVRIGNEFGSFRMIRRAFIPALFSLSMGGVISGLIRDLLYTEPLLVLDVVRPAYLPLSSVVSALVLLPIILAFFAPTWILNDSGIVMHLKDKELRVRKCPDTIGVGRWWSNLLGGFTLFMVPVVTFVQYFYTPIVIHNQLLNSDFLFRALLLTVGVPLLAVAFVLPLIVFHEILVRGTRYAIVRVAKKLGAKEMELETVLVPSEIQEHEEGSAVSPES